MVIHTDCTGKAQLYFIAQNIQQFLLEDFKTKIK